MKALKLTISVFDFSDYSLFLKAAYLDLKNQDERFSHRVLQRKAGYATSSSHFWQRMNGRSPLGADAARRYGRALGLNRRELDFFMLLAAMNQAKSDEERNYYFESIKAFPEFSERAGRPGNSWKYYEYWYLPALRALTSLDSFREDPKWIGQQLVPPITPVQAEKGLERLLEMGYLVREPSGRLKCAEPLIGSYDDRREEDPVQRLALRNYTRKMGEMAVQSLDQQTQAQRYLVGNTMSISRNQAHELRQLVSGFMRNVEALIARNEPAEIVYRMNVQLFSLSRWPEDKTGNKKERGDE